MALTLGLSLGLGLPLALLIGGALGYYLAMKFFKKQLRENPPITKETIREMYKQVGRTPNEQQVNAMYKKVVKNVK